MSDSSWYNWLSFTTNYVINCSTSILRAFENEWHSFNCFQMPIGPPKRPFYYQIPFWLMHGLLNLSPLSSSFLPVSALSFRSHLEIRFHSAIRCVHSPYTVLITCLQETIFLPTLLAKQLILTNLISSSLEQIIQENVDKRFSDHVMESRQRLLTHLHSPDLPHSVYIPSRLVIYPYHFLFFSSFISLVAVFLDTLLTTPFLVSEWCIEVTSHRRSSRLFSTSRFFKWQH